STKGSGSSRHRSSPTISCSSASNLFLFIFPRYVVSPYVAEFWNSLSNIPFFCVPAAYCLYRGQIYDMRVKMIWISMFVVGLGSFMFHGTMRFEWEMWDEVPMFLLVLSAIVSKDDVHWMTSGIWKHLIHLLSFGAATVGMCMLLGRLEGSEV
ncbi:Acer2, partial [Symbiodinium necroappetens]